MGRLPTADAAGRVHPLQAGGAKLERGGAPLRAHTRPLSAPSGPYVSAQAPGPLQAGVTVGVRPLRQTLQVQPWAGDAPAAGVRQGAHVPLPVLPAEVPPERQHGHPHKEKTSEQ